MDYKNYKMARDLSWQILLDAGVAELPVSVYSLCKQMGIVVRLYESQTEDDGLSTIINGKPVIFIDNRCSIQRQRFTAAHELGHILAGHTGQFKLVNREPSTTDNPIEQEANVFASRLLAPSCVLWGCGAKTVDDIMRLCNISKQAAEYRMERMKILYARSKFLTSPVEKEVYEQFEEYIRRHKKK